MILHCDILVNHNMILYDNNTRLTPHPRILGCLWSRNSEASILNTNKQ